MGGVFRAIQRLFIFVVFWSTWILSTIVVSAMVGIGHFIWQRTGTSPNRTKEHALACYWPILCWCFNFWWLKITIDGKENLPREGEAVVMVANHESAFDIFTMYFLRTQFRWLSKKEVFSIPVLGHSMRWLGYVPVERGNQASHAKAMETSAEWIRRGIPMFYFPEGTRSETSELRPFKSGAFRLAKDTGVDVLPIAISGAREIMPKGSMIPAASHIHIRVMPRERQGDNETVEAFSARVREKIIATRNELLSRTL